MPRVIFLKPARVLVTAIPMGGPTILHLPMQPVDVLGTGYAPTLCGGFGDIWSPLVFDRDARMCRFCRRNAVATASLFLIGPERSEGPSLARRGQGANHAGPTAGGDTSCKSAVSGDGGPRSGGAAEPGHGALGGGGGS
jgi:hypothetical protein